MKKKHLLKIVFAIFIFILGITNSNAQTVLITTIVDGTLADDSCSGGSGSDPRFLELYVDGTINFAGYDLDVETNGSYDGAGLAWVSKNISDLGSITDQFVYLVLSSDLNSFDSIFPNKTRIGIALGTINGNDSFRLEDSSSNVLDLFGNPSEITNSAVNPSWDYEDSYAKRIDFKTPNAGIFSSSNWVYGGANALDSPNNTCTHLAATVTLGSYSVKTTTWTGSTSSNWTVPSNWDNGVPTPGYNASIPNIGTAPIIDSSTQAYTGDLTITETDGLTINSGGSLIVNGTSSGNVTYNRTLTYDADVTKSWHLVSSPFSGEIMTDMRTNNSFLTNVSNEISFAPYDNSQADLNDRWSYFGNTATDALENGKGYSTKLSASGDIYFTGTINNSDVAIALTLGSSGSGNDYNLIGNPFTASINSGSFLTSNTSELSQEEIYVWHEASEQYLTKTSGINFKVSPGQGFFVEALSTNNVTFFKSIQSHETDDFQKSSSTEIKLNITDGSLTRFADIYYIDGTTTGFDNGYDGKLFGGVPQPFALYTHLVSESNADNFQIQSLPNSNLESMIIPVGVNATIGKEITFSAEALNLPTEIKVFLEDRLTNTFTRLDETNSEYKITLTEALNGIGRFYLHTAQSVLSTDDVILNSVSIYKTNASTLKIAGLPQGKASISLYNIIGKEMMSTSFTSNGNKEISLSKLSSGVYVAKVKTEKGVLSKKIILE